jgi:hypothetical protein
MSAPAAISLALWLVMSLLSLWVWLPTGRGPGAALRELRRVRVAVLGGLLGLAVLSAAFATWSAPVVDLWAWLAGVIAASVAVLGGGAVTTIVLALAGGGSASARVQRDVLRGGAWIGVLERLALLGTLMTGWPEGAAVIVAVKGLARYPELRSATAIGTGANERFIIGTLASLGWAAATAWVLTELL